MKHLPGDADDGKPKDATANEAANESVIEGGGRPPAWDPFEVWRTRVRDVRDRRSQRKTPPEED